MTHIEQEALSQAFGGQTVDLYGVNSLREQMVHNQETGEVQATTPDVFGAMATQAAAEVVGSSWEKAAETYERTRRLFEGQFAVPDLTEFARAGIDFAELKAGFEGYERAGMKPEMVFAPINLPLNQWQATYTRLREWQDQHDPDSGFRLQNKSDGDGLYIWPAVASNWEPLNNQAVSETPGHSVALDGVIWKALVVPTAPKEDGGLAINTSHDLTTNNLGTQAAAAAIPEANITEANAHMPIGAYLALQGAHILDKQPLLDSDTWTWAAGTFDNGSLQAPALRWSPDSGRVSVGNGDVGGSGDGVGVRLPVWG